MTGPALPAPVTIPQTLIGAGGGTLGPWDIGGAAEVQIAYTLAQVNEPAYARSFIITNPDSTQQVMPPDITAGGIRRVRAGSNGAVTLRWKDGQGNPLPWPAGTSIRMHVVPLNAVQSFTIGGGTVTVA